MRCSSQLSRSSLLIETWMSLYSMMLLQGHQEDMLANKSAKPVNSFTISLTPKSWLNQRSWKLSTLIAAKFLKSNQRWLTLLTFCSLTTTAAILLVELWLRKRTQAISISRLYRLQIGAIRNKRSFCGWSTNNCRNQWQKNATKLELWERAHFPKKMTSSPSQTCAHPDSSLNATHASTTKRLLSPCDWFLWFRSLWPRIVLCEVCLTLCIRIK